MAIKDTTKDSIFGHEIFPHNHGILINTLAALLCKYARTAALSIGENSAR